MVMIKSLFLAGLMFALARGDPSPTKPAMATLHVQSNFDFSLTKKEFRVHYSGLGGFVQKETTDKVTIKIYDPKGNEFHSYEVDDENKDQKKAYYFALDDAVDGEYQVEVCSGTTCSGKTPSLTNIESKEIKLTCEKGKKDTTGDSEKWTRSGDISLDFNGPAISDWIRDPSTEFETIESTLNAAIRNFDPSSKFVYQTEYKKHGMSANPAYHNRKLYAAIKFNIAEYKALFDKYRGKTENREEYAHDSCKRKYLLSAHLHLVDTNTKEVKYRYKTTLHLSGVGKQYYILAPDANTRKVHVEMIHQNVDIEAGSYKVHVIFCATEKDAIESTFCADPVIYDRDLTVSRQD